MGSVGLLPWHTPAGIAAAPCCRLRHGFVSWRRLPQKAHVQFTKPQADKIGIAESPAVRKESVHEEGKRLEGGRKRRTEQCWKEGRGEQKKRLPYEKETPCIN